MALRKIGQFWYIYYRDVAQKVRTIATAETNKAKAAVKDRLWMAQLAAEKKSRKYAADPSPTAISTFQILLFEGLYHKTQLLCARISGSRQIFNLKYSLSRNLYACLINHLILLRNPFIPALPICRKIEKLISRSVLTIVLDSVESMNPLLIASGQPHLTSPRFRFRSSPRLPCGELPDAPELSPLRRRCLR